MLIERKEPAHPSIDSDRIVRFLFDRYYQQEVTAAQPHISSHWESNFERFHIKLNEQNDITTPYSHGLDGFGFGNFKWKGLGWFFDQASVISHLLHLPRKAELIRIQKIAGEILKKIGFDPTLDVFRQTCTVELLKENLPSNLQKKRIRILCIGDGYGVFGILFKTIFPNSVVTFIDLGKTLFFQAYHARKIHPDVTHRLAADVKKNEESDFIYCPAEQLESLEPFQFDLAVNIVSMQEMNEETIHRYFNFLRSHLAKEHLFYCCNRESKEMVGGEVASFFNYPWKSGDQHLIDELCPWHQYFFSRRRFRKGPDIFGLPIPFVNFYGGKTYHRLSILTKE